MKTYKIKFLILMGLFQLHYSVIYSQDLLAGMENHVSWDLNDKELGCDELENYNQFHQLCWTETFLENYDIKGKSIYLVQNNERILELFGLSGRDITTVYKDDYFELASYESISKDFIILAAIGNSTKGFDLKIFKFMREYQGDDPKKAFVELDHFENVSLVECGKNSLKIKHRNIIVDYGYLK